MTNTGLTRKEKEKLVVELYKKDMTYAQIAKEAHVSLRDIGPILNRAGEHQSLSNSSQAYKMFSEGSSPIQVAIILNLREKDVNEYYREFWDLNGLWDLNQIYQETKGNIHFIIQLYRSVISAGLNIVYVINLLKIANNDIPTIEYKIRELEREEATFNIRIQRAAETFQEFNDDISKERKILEQYSSEVKRVKLEIAQLRMEKTRLENFVSSFRINNETIVRIKQLVAQEIETLISNPSRLMRFAVASIFESARKHPGQFHAMYYHMSTAEIQSLLQTSISQNEHDSNQYGHGEDTPEKILLGEAEQFFSKLIDYITGKCINEITTDTKSISQTEQVWFAI